jgi:hypothetical protein
MCGKVLLKESMIWYLQLINLNPQNTTPINFTEGTAVFCGSGETHCPIPLDVKWELNRTIGGISDRYLSYVEEEEWEEGNNTLVVTVIDTTSMLRSENHGLLHFYTVLWTINKTSTATQNVLSQKYEVEIYPNPVQTQLNIRLTSETNEAFDIHVCKTLGGSPL